VLFRSHYVWDALAASIGSGATQSQSESLLAFATSTTFAIFAGAAFLTVVLVSGCFHQYYPTYPEVFTFHAWTLEMDSMNGLDQTRNSYQGEPMDVDSSDQGDTVNVNSLAFPHIVGEDGQHTVQHIDM
jgi:hypothetical protein